jgi:SAM-dependent methyltransferase
MASNEMTRLTRHLDLGCGYSPKNPLNQSMLYGCDLLDIPGAWDSPNFVYKQADIVFQGIPYPDSYFDSVSAFDFIEHVPRQSVSSEGKPTLPFIELMNEIHRVLVPGGMLLASTPAFPHPQAFQDPTHVNIITDKTHEYFCGDAPYARRYGFKGSFRVERVAFDLGKNVYDRQASRLKKALRNFHRRWFKGGQPHLTWELVAEK